MQGKLVLGKKREVTSSNPDSGCSRFFKNLFGFETTRIETPPPTPENKSTPFFTRVKSWLPNAEAREAAKNAAIRANYREKHNLIKAKYNK